MKTVDPTKRREEKPMKTVAILFVAFAVLVCTAPANAQRLLGTLYAGNTGGPSILVEINPDTGALVQTIGSVGYLVNGMTWDATTSTLYATTSQHDANFPNGLIKINPATGASTRVGSGAGQDVNVPACNSTGVLYGWTEATDDLVLWNKVAGTITVFGDSGVDTAEEGLAFNTLGVLYLVNWDGIYTINTSTGVGTFVGSIGRLAHHGSFRSTNNLYYGVDQTEDTSGPPRSLIVVNVATQTVVNTIPTVDLLHTLTFVSAAPDQVIGAPTMTEWGMIILVILLGIGSIYYLRRRVAA